jgi:hypothetical protein
LAGIDRVFNRGKDLAVLDPLKIQHSRQSCERLLENTILSQKRQKILATIEYLVTGRRKKEEGRRKKSNLLSSCATTPTVYRSPKYLLPAEKVSNTYQHRMRADFSVEMIQTQPMCNLKY